VYDITDRKRAEAQLFHDALHDALTGLPNRVLFMERVDQALKHSKRHKDNCFAVLFIDLDRFKIVNDSLGHAMGDQLLIVVAHILEDCLRTTDTVARLSGDEFTILLEDIEDLSGATKIAERILERLAQSITLNDHTVFISASIGIVFSSTGYEQAADLLRDADIAMYRAKELGKARYAIFDQEMYSKTLKLLQMENDLRLALDRREFLLAFQPIISLPTERLIGFEALLRWHHPELGSISPAEFIPVAEDTGLIIPIGEWVIYEACRQLRIWQQQFPQANALKLSINLAGQQIKSPNFIQRLEQILAETGMDGRCLRLEITETMLMDQGEETIQILSEIRALNIQLSLDDFGKGYSSLSYLHRFPINTIKIDQSFVSQMSTEDENFEIVRTITTLAHTLGMDVVAEGVETAHQLAQLKTLGCEFGQGYFFSKPLDVSAAMSMIAGLS
jgi:diguanylate cyclase (GGDEF)-like protein